LKYYAVTDDINELYHYGVKGMKWGQHLFGDDLKPKSPGYKRAANKLRNIAKSIRKDVEVKSNLYAQRRAQKSQDRYTRQLAKAQKRSELSKQKYKLDQLNKDSDVQIYNISGSNYDRQLAKAQKRSELSRKKYGWDQVANSFRENDQAFNNARKEIARVNKANQTQQKYESRVLRSKDKQLKRAANAEKNFDRYLQDAREGHLRAKNLSDDQIQRINNRLNVERTTRQLGGTEKASYKARKKEAFREGKLEGIRRGTATGMEELARGIVQMGIKNRMVKAATNRSEARRQRTRNRILNKKSRRDMRREFKEEAYEESIREDPRLIRGGIRRLGGTMVTGIAAKNLKKIESDKRENKRIQANQDRARDESDRAWKKFVDSHGGDERTALSAYKKDLERRSASGDSEAQTRLTQLRNLDTRTQTKSVKEARRNLIIGDSQLKEDERASERRRNVSDKLATEKEERYQRMLEEQGISDTEMRERQKARLSPAGQSVYDSFDTQKQRDIALRAEESRERSEAIQEGERFNREQEQYRINMQNYREERKNYLAALKTYNDKMNGYADQVADYKAKIAAGATKLQPPVPPQMKRPVEPQMPRPPRQISPRHRKVLNGLGYKLYEGGGGGNKN
jgi:hypothetical protein